MDEGCTIPVTLSHLYVSDISGLLDRSKREEWGYRFLCMFSRVHLLLYMTCINGYRYFICEVGVLYVTHMQSRWEDFLVADTVHAFHPLTMSYRPIYSKDHSPIWIRSSGTIDCRSQREVASASGLSCPNVH